MSGVSVAHMSIGWQPGDAVSRILASKGYWPETIKWLGQDYHIRVLTGGRVAEADLDADFLLWVGRTIPDPVVRSAISNWRPGRQLRMYIQYTGMAGEQRLMGLYRQAVIGRDEQELIADHDAAFKAFAERWR